MKKIIKKLLIGAGILIPTISIPISTSCILKNKNNLNVENQNINSSLLTKANESYQYYNYDTAIVDQQIEKIKIVTNYDLDNPTIPKNQVLTFTYNFAFRDYVPDNGYADVFLQLTKLDFLFDDIKIQNRIYDQYGKYTTKYYQIPFQFNFNYKKDELNSQFGSGNQEINFKSFYKNEPNENDTEYDFPFGDYQGKQYIFNLNTKVYNDNFPVNPYPSTNLSGVGVKFQDLIDPASKMTNLTVIRDPDNTTNTIQFNFKFVTQDGYLFASPNYNLTNVEKNFKLKITSNYFINSTSNVVYDKLVVASNRLQIWNPTSYPSYNIINPLSVGEEPNIENNWRKLYFDTTKPVVNLNNIYLNNQVNKTYNVDVYLTDVVFGNQNGSNITTANHFPLYINLDINPSVDKTIHVNKNIDIFGGITLNVQFDLKQDENDPLKYYLYDTNNPNIEIKNKGYINLVLNKSNIYNGLNVADNFVLAIANNFDSLTIFNPDFDIREIVHYIKSSINQDIILNVEQKSIRKINPENAVNINSDSNILDIFDNSYINGSISNKQLILNEINTRIDNFLALQSVQKWINADSNANPRDSFFPIAFKTTYKSVGNDISLVDNYYAQGIVNVKIEPRQTNNYIFSIFDFDINVYASQSSNWKQLLTAKVNSERVSKLFSSYYSWKQLSDQLNTGLDTRKSLLTDLLIINDNRISNYQFNALINDINLEYRNGHYWLNVSINNDSYCFYDNLNAVYTNQISIDLGKQNFKEPDKVYLVDLDFYGEKLYEFIHENYTNIDDFINDYNSGDKTSQFFNIKTNSDRIDSIVFSKTDISNELKININVKSGFENDLYCVTKINNSEFEYDENNSSYSLVMSNLLFQGEVSDLVKLDLNFNPNTLWEIIHNFNSYNDFLDEFNSNPHYIDACFNVNEIVSNPEDGSSENYSSFNQYIKSIQIATTKTNQRIKISVKLNPGYQFADQSSYNTVKNFYVGNILTRLEDPLYTPYNLLTSVSIYLDKEKITKLKLSAKNLDSFVNDFNTNNSNYLDLFLNNYTNDMDISKVIQPEYITADWYKNENGKAILRFTVCLKNGYYFAKSNLKDNSGNYHQFYNQYEINVDDLVNDDQVVIGGHKVDKNLVIGLSVGGGILLIAIIITVWSLYVHFHNKHRLERSREE